MSRKHKKDTDYLSVSAWLHVMETRLLTRERLEQLLEAREDSEAARVLADCGYPEPQPLTLPAVEQSLAAAQAQLMEELAKALPDDPQVLSVFQVKYDYHNAKVLVKSEAREADPVPLLVQGGRYDPQRLLEDYRQGDLPQEGYRERFQQAVAEARSLLATSKDPQLSDLLLDKACYAEMADAAKGSGSGFLAGYVAAQVDALNLKTAVRALRAEKNPDFIRRAMLPGGTVDPEAIAAADGEALAGVFQNTPLAQAAQAGVALLTPGKGDMTAFERLCDNAVTAYVSQARRVPFGVETVVGYLHARDTERTAIRTILSGRLAGIGKDVIRERLREGYV